MGIKDEIRTGYSYLREGESTTGQQTGVCPCGKPSERCSLGVTKRSGVILYNCLSVSCHVGGGRVSATTSRTDDTTEGRPVHASTPPVRQFDAISRQLPDSARDWLKKYNIGKATITRYDIGFHEASGRIVFPCLNLRGEHVQNTARMHSKHHPAKWLHEKGGMSDYVYFDPYVIRGLDYYTGTVYEGKSKTPDIRRSISGGGRYDNLLADV